MTHSKNQMLNSQKCHMAIYPGIQFRFPCTPGQFFMGAKLFIGTPCMRNEVVLKKIGMGYVKMHGFHGNL